MVLEIIHRTEYEILRTIIENKIKYLKSLPRYEDLNMYPISQKDYIKVKIEDLEDILKEFDKLPKKVN